MKKLAQILYSLTLLLSVVIQARSDTNPKHANTPDQLPGYGIGPDTAMTCIHVDRISDINFHDQEYSIEFSLTINYRRHDFNFEQLEVLNAKRKKFSVLKVDSTNHGYIARLKASCVMGQMWNVFQYPFDGQDLELNIYHPLYDKSRLIFMSDGHGLHKNTTDELENGWKIFGTPKTFSNEFVPRAELKDHSNLKVTIDIHREHPLWLFLKLFIGMYVAFFVAYIAFFIDVKQADPRFGLPVGALFAAIGNKYITESILPQSPDFTIIDWLHTFTFLAILFIIAFSAFSLKLRSMEDQYQYVYMKKRFDRRMSRLKWIHKRQHLLVLLVYLTVNLFTVIWAGSHPHETRSNQVSEHVEHHDHSTHI